MHAPRTFEREAAVFRVVKIDPVDAESTRFLLLGETSFHAVLAQRGPLLPAGVSFCADLACSAHKRRWTTDNPGCRTLYGTSLSHPHN